MKTFALRLAATALAFASSLGLAHAEVVTQSKSFEGALSVSGSGTSLAASNTFFKASFSPFDSSLGTLTAFSISWSSGLSAVFATSSFTGYLSSGIGGGYSINGLTYSDDSVSGNTVGAANKSGLTLDLSTSDVGSWLASNAGLTYNPALLAAMKGSSPVVLAFAAPIAVTYGNLASADVGVGGKVTLDYTYTPSAGPAANDVPEPTSLALAFGGLLAAALVRRSPARSARLRA